MSSIAKYTTGMSCVFYLPMKTERTKRRFRARFPRCCAQFLHRFLFCSHPPKSYLLRRRSDSHVLIVSPSLAVTRSHRCLSQSSIDRSLLQLSSYPRMCRAIDQGSSSDLPMPQITLLEAEFCTEHDDRRRQADPLSFSVSSSSSSSLSSPTSNCLTIHQCYSTSTISNDDPVMLTNSSVPLNDNSPPLPSASHFSYFIRPSTPCVLGREHYDEDVDDDEFFLTAGGIVHSCPNIYELATNNRRKLQSCDHLIVTDRQASLLDPNHSDQELNAYDTELDRYSVVPRFQPLLTSSSSSFTQSNDSLNSELKLYKARHANGLCRLYVDDDICTSASYLPTSWKSDNHLVYVPVVNHQSSLFKPIDPSKRSRSHDTTVEQSDASILS